MVLHFVQQFDDIDPPNLSDEAIAKRGIDMVAEAAPDVSVTLEVPLDMGQILVPDLPNGPGAPPEPPSRSPYRVDDFPGAQASFGKAQGRAGAEHGGSLRLMPRDADTPMLTRFGTRESIIVRICIEARWRRLLVSPLLCRFRPLVGLVGPRFVRCC